VERLETVEVTVVAGSDRNIKITRRRTSTWHTCSCAKKKSAKPETFPAED
jgi:hypothetical protein